MENKSYNWKQVISYSVIALHNLLNLANEVNLENKNVYRTFAKITY